MATESGYLVELRVGECRRRRRGKTYHWAAIGLFLGEFVLRNYGLILLAGLTVVGGTGAAQAITSLTSDDSRDLATSSTPEYLNVLEDKYGSTSDKPQLEVIEEASDEAPAEPAQAQATLASTSAPTPVVAAAPAPATPAPVVERVSQSAPAPAPAPAPEPVVQSAETQAEPMTRTEPERQVRQAAPQPSPQEVVTEEVEETTPETEEDNDTTEVEETEEEVVTEEAEVVTQDPNALSDAEVQAIIADSDTISNGRQFFERDEPLRQMAKNIDATPGYYNIAIHGPTFTEVRIGETRYTASQFAQVIKADPTWNGQDIKFISCNIGGDPDGFAQQLANELGVNVVAANTLTWINSRGDYYVTEGVEDARGNLQPVRPYNGEFVEFRPQG